MFDAAQEKIKALTHKVNANKKVEYPSKTTINLVEVVQDGAASKSQRNIIVLAVVLLVLVFVKFGMIDPLMEANNETAKVASLQSELTVLQQQNTDYAKIKQQLDKYSAPGMNEDEQTYANRTHALAVADSVSGLGKQLDSVSLTGNTLKIQLVDTNLTTVSDVVSKVKKNKWVESVLPNTAANTEDSSLVTATITVQLIPAAGTGTTDGSAGDGSDSSGAASDAGSASSSTEGE